MNIRPYDEADERAVVALWREAFANPLPWNDPLQSIRRKLAVQRELFFVAEDDGTVIGTAMGGYDGHRGHLYSVAVVPRHRRGGIGSALVRRVEAEIAKLGCPKINLHVEPGIENAVAFYEKLGFKVEEWMSMAKVLDGSAPPA